MRAKRAFIKGCQGVVFFLAALGAIGLFCPQRLPAQDETGFPDVPKNHWAYQAVTDLKRRGILIGYPPGGVTQVESHSATATVSTRRPGTATKHRRPSASYRNRRELPYPARRKVGRQR